MAVDYESMSQEELEAVDIETIGSMDPDVDTEGVPDREAPVETPEAKETSEKPDDKPEDKPEDKTVEGSDNGDVVPDEGDGTKVNRNGDPVEGDPLKDTQADLTRKNVALSKAVQENEELKRKLEEKDIDMPEQLSEEELDDLADSDPRAYREYVDKMAHATAKKETLDVQRKEHVTRTMHNNLHTVINELWKVDVDLSKPYEQQSPGAQKLIDSGKLQKFDDYIINNYKPDSDGIFSVDQLRGAQKAIFFDEMVAVEREKTRTDVVNNISKASEQTSVLDTHPGESQRVKAVDDYSQEEIDNMSPEQLDEVLKTAGVRI